MKTIPLTQGKVALVDDEDFETLSQFKWNAQCAGNVFYAYRHCSETWGRVAMHRQVMGAPKGTAVAHLDGDGLNNQKVNMRIATTQENARSKRHRPTHRSSSFRGVSRHDRPRPWRAEIYPHGASRKHLGYFASEAEAADAYNKAAKEHYGEFAELNPI